MEYKFKCSVDLGSYCCGCGCDYEDFFTVDITDEEAEDIRKKVDFNSDDLMSALERIIPDTHRKILFGAYDVVNYAVARECRISGMWQDARDIEAGDVDEDELMRYDIEYRGFNPVDKNGNPLDGIESYSAWIEWEEEQLKDLTFRERAQFYMDRYKFSFEDNGLTQFEVEFPEDLKTFR